MKDAPNKLLPLKKPSLILLAFLQFQCAIAQSKSSCNCPENEYTTNAKPNKIFTFSTGQKLSVCGEAEKKNDEIQYDGCIVFQCGKSKSIYESDHTKPCIIKQTVDTIFIHEITPIANGKNQSIVWTKFHVEKLFFRNDKLVDTNYYRSDVNRYTAKEIQKIEAAYKIFKKENNFDGLLLLAHQLFWAYVSGSKKAGDYLTGLEKKFGSLDGVVSEEFSEILANFEMFKKKTKGKR